MRVSVAAVSSAFIITARDAAVAIDERMDLGDQEHHEDRSRQRDSRARPLQQPSFRVRLDELRGDELGAPARLARCLIRPGRFLGPPLDESRAPSARARATASGSGPGRLALVGRTPVGPDHVVRILRTSLGGSAHEDDPLRLLDRELRALDEVREVRLEERGDTHRAGGAGPGGAMPAR